MAFSGNGRILNVCKEILNKIVSGQSDTTVQDSINSNVNNKVDNMNNNIDSVGANVESVNEKVDNLNTSLESIITKVNTLESDIDTLKTTLNTVSSNIKSGKNAEYFSLASGVSKSFTGKGILRGCVTSKLNNLIVDGVTLADSLVCTNGMSYNGSYYFLEIPFSKTISFKTSGDSNSLAIIYN